MKGPLQGQPPGLSCGNVGQMRSPNTVHMDVCTYPWVFTYGWLYILYIRLGKLIYSGEDFSQWLLH